MILAPGLLYMVLFHGPSESRVVRVVPWVIVGCMRSIGHSSRFRVSGRLCLNTSNRRPHWLGCDHLTCFNSCLHPLIRPRVQVGRKLVPMHAGVDVLRGGVSDIPYWTLSLSPCWCICRAGRSHPRTTEGRWARCSCTISPNT